MLKKYDLEFLQKYNKEFFEHIDSSEEEFWNEVKSSIHLIFGTNV